MFFFHHESCFLNEQPLYLISSGRVDERRTIRMEGWCAQHIMRQAKQPSCFVYDLGGEVGKYEQLWLLPVFCSQIQPGICLVRKPPGLRFHVHHLCALVLRNTFCASVSIRKRETEFLKNKSICFC